MAENKTLNIIKKVILLEHRGKALYESAAHKTEVAAVKELFEMLAEEEEKHIDILNKQFILVAKGKNFEAGELDKVESTTAKTVLSQAIVKGISGAGYEAAVIAVALEFEKNAVKYYIYIAFR
jgi:rubrerythrin